MTLFIVGFKKFEEIEDSLFFIYMNQSMKLHYSSFLEYLFINLINKVKHKYCDTIKSDKRYFLLIKEKLKITI